MNLVTRRLPKGTVVNVSGIPMRLSRETNVRTTPTNWQLAKAKRSN